MSTRKKLTFFPQTKAQELAFFLKNNFDLLLTHFSQIITNKRWTQAKKFGAFRGEILKQSRQHISLRT